MLPFLAPSRRFDQFRIAGCKALLAILAGYYVLIVASVPAFFRLTIAGAVPTQSIGDEILLSQALLTTGAAQRGMSLSVYVLYDLALNGLVAVGFWCAAGLVAWRAKQAWYRWFTAAILAFFPTGNLWPFFAAAHPLAAAYLDVLSLLWPCFLIFLYLFPTGQAVPRWSRWPMALFCLVHLAIQILGYLVALPGSPIHRPPAARELALVVPLAFGYIMLCQIYRYLRSADAVVRKQIQWFVAAMALIGVGSLVQAASGDVNATGGTGYAADFDTVTSLLVPVTITIAILRYRLWDIDVIIRRTLIYSLLTGLLALAYLGSVLVLQRLFQALTGQVQNQLATIISTLAIAALFVPLRRRVQDFIDRRFYRRKYDAARILTEFAASAREDVNLDGLTDRLRSVVSETLKPSSVEVWLRGSERRE